MAPASIYTLTIIFGNLIKKLKYANLFVKLDMCMLNLSAGMAKSVDFDQTAPLGAGWLGLTLFGRLNSPTIMVYKI